MDSVVRNSDRAQLGGTVSAPGCLGLSWKAHRLGPGIISGLIRSMSGGCCWLSAGGWVPFRVDSRYELVGVLHSMVAGFHRATMPKRES